MTALSLVTLKQWRGLDNQYLLVIESPALVLARMAKPRSDGTVHLTFIMGLEERELYTRPENIACVEANQ